MSQRNLEHGGPELSPGEEPKRAVLNLFRTRPQPNQAFEALIESSGIGTYRWWPKDNRITMSATFAAFFGKTPADFDETLSRVHARIHSADVDRIRKKVSQILHGGAIDLSDDIRVRQLDGSTLWLRTYAVLEQGSNPDEAHLVGTAIDVTAEKENDRSLQKMERQLALAESVAGVGQWIFDLQINEIIWSDKVYEVHGVTRDHYRPELMSAVEFYHPEDRQTVQEALNNSIADQRPFSFELRLVRPDGSVRNVLAKGEPQVGLNGETTALYGIFQDITEDRKVDTLKGEFLSAISHQLRNPLASVSGALDILYDQSANGLDQRASTLLDLTRRNCRRLSTLIDDFFEQGQFLVDGTPTKNGVYELSHLTDGIVDQHQPIAETSAVTLLFDRDAISLTTKIDAGLFEHLVSILITNAIKLSSPGSTVALTLEEHTDVVRLRVENDGPGISPELIPRLFDSFQADGSPLTRENSGLGFARSLAEKMGGTLTLGDDFASQNTFALTIPTSLSSATEVAR